MPIPNDFNPIGSFSYNFSSGSLVLFGAGSKVLINDLSTATNISYQFIHSHDWQVPDFHFNKATNCNRCFEDTKNVTFGDNVSFDAIKTADYMFTKSSGLNFSSACLDFILKSQTITSAVGMFYACSGINFPETLVIDMPNLTNASGIITNVTSSNVKKAIIKLPSVNNISTSVEGVGRNGLYYDNTTERIYCELPILQDGIYCFSRNTRLQEVEGDFHSLTNGTQFCRGCTSLYSFKANLPKLSNGTDMFNNCVLNEESVLRILNTIPSYSDGSHSLHMGRKVNFATSNEIATILGTNVPIVAGNYSYKGWTITIAN